MITILRPHLRAAAALGVLLLASVASAEVEPALSIEVGSPQKLSANLGLRIGLVGEGEADYGKGLLIQVQPGLGGGALNVGFAPVALPAWGSQAVGFVVKARLLRTWGDPWAIEPDQTFAGGEVGLAWIVKVSVGVLTRVGSGGEGKKTIVTWSFGIGL